MIGLERHASVFEFSTVSVTFRSSGTECAGWLYRPDRPRRPPLVVMGPGLADERTFGYTAYAERLAERGYAVFLFDYRFAGESGGRPRGLVRPAAQRADWEAAVDRAVRLDGVDADRLVLWGASLAGGHVLRIAAEDSRVDAVVAQSPVVDGRALLRANGLRWLARGLTEGLLDRLGGVVGQRRRLRVVQEPRTDKGGAPDDPGPPRDTDTEGFALLNGDGVGQGYLERVPLRSDWTNGVPARVVHDLWGFRPGAVAADVRVPALVLTGSRDSVVPVDAVRAVADSLAEATVVTLPTGHFDLFAEPWRTRALGHQLTFLDGVV